MSLSLVDISKSFGPVRALDRVDFEVQAGEVHALLGENGAGKSTLMHVAFGLVTPDGGRVAVDGVPVRLRSPRDARRLGLGMVHQHFTSVPALSVAENVALAAGWPARPAANARALRALGARHGLPLDPEPLVETLPVALRQRLEILKALAPGARTLLLDEPTGVLAPAEVEELLRVIRGLAAGGAGVVLITHKLREALAVAGRVTVLRAGRVAWTGPAAAASEALLAAAMLGHEPAPSAGPAANPPRPAAPAGRPAVLRLEGAAVPPDGGRGPGLRRASLTLRAGDLVGVAAVEGNGQRELLRLAAGVLAPSAGVVERAGVAALVPEDRTTEGIIPRFTVTENLALAGAGQAPWSRRGIMRWGAGREAATALIARHGVRTAGPDTPAGALSGGNQQKLVLARALDRRPALLVAENPTRGLDLHATAAMHAALRDAARDGAAVLFHSSDLDEVLALAGRVLVVAGGTVVEAPPGAGRAQVGRLMLGRDEGP